SRGTSSNPTSRRRPLGDALVASEVLSTEGGTSMSGARQNSNLAARMGRWSAAHWKTATFGWLALVVVAFAVGGQVGTKKVDPNTAGPGESGRLDRTLDAGFRLPAGAGVWLQGASV